MGAPDRQVKIIALDFDAGTVSIKTTGFATLAVEILDHHPATITIDVNDAFTLSNAPKPHILEFHGEGLIYIKTLTIETRRD
jgi:hypothetical protein